MKETKTYPNEYYEEESELSLADIIQIVQDYVREVFNNWKLIPLFIIPIAIVLVYQAVSSRPQYSAGVTFLVTKEDKQSFGEIGALLGGIGGLAGGMQEESALEKVLQLFRSRKIIQNTLFQKVTVNNKNDYIANHMIVEYGWGDLTDQFKSFGLLKPTWAKKIDPEFKYNHSVIDSFQRNENIALKVLYETVVGNQNLGVEPIVSSGIDEKSGIMRIALSTVSEGLTREMLLSMYDQLSQYYIDKTIEKQLKIYRIAEFKRDSIAVELNIADRKLAEFEDENRNLVWVRGELERTRLQRESRILEMMYGEAITQLEMSDFALRRKTPYVQMIDEPAKPIIPKTESPITAAILASIVGGFLAVLFILARKAIRDLLDKELGQNKDEPILETT